MTVTDEITETIEGPDEAAILAFPGGETTPDDEAPTYRSILETWAFLLDGAKESHKNNPRISPQWCGLMVQMYPDITFKDCRGLHDLYFARTQVLNEILLDVIRKHQGCYKVSSAQEDREENSGAYKEVLTEWQLQITRWELAWDPDSSAAHQEFACFAEMHKAFFGDTGLTQYLDNIQLEYTEADQAALQAELTALKEGDRE